MKRLLRISALLLLYCLSTAKSCDDREENDAAGEQAMVTAARDSIRSAISTESLSEETLRGFEESARQKLSDFSDYSRILSDTCLNAAFRQKAADLISDLFINDTVIKINNSLGNFKFDSVQVLAPLNKTGNNCYLGQLSFVETTISKYPKSGKSNSQRFSSIYVHLIKRKILIGNDTINSWKVYLSKIH